MAVLRMVVRGTRVRWWFVRLRAAQGRFTFTGGGNANVNVSWTWNGETVAPGVTATSSVTLATMSYPTWEEDRKPLGPDCRAIDWIHARYQLARD